MKVEQQTGITSEMILQSLGEGIQCLDLDGYISFTNPVAARMVGFAVEDLWRMAAGAILRGRRGEHPHRVDELVDRDSFEYADVLEECLGHLWCAAGCGRGRSLSCGNRDARRADERRPDEKDA